MPNGSFRANLRPVGLLSVWLVLLTTLVVGLVAWAVIPGSPLAAGWRRTPMLTTRLTTWPCR